MGDPQWLWGSGEYPVRTIWIQTARMTKYGGIPGHRSSVGLVMNQYWVESRRVINVGRAGSPEPKLLTTTVTLEINLTVVSIAQHFHSITILSTDLSAAPHPLQWRLSPSLQKPNSRTCLQLKKFEVFRAISRLLLNIFWQLSASKCFSFQKKNQPSICSKLAEPNHNLDQLTLFGKFQVWQNISKFRTNKTFLSRSLQPGQVNVCL